MSTSQNPDHRSGRKRKHENDGASPAERSKRSKLERRRDKNAAKERQYHKSILHNSSNEATVPEWSAPNTRKAHRQAYQPLEEGLPDVPVKSEKTRSKEKRRGRKIEKESWTAKMRPSSGKRTKESCSTGGLDDEKQNSTTNRTTDNKMRKKAEKRQLRNPEIDVSELSVKQRETKSAAKSTVPSWTLSPPSAGRLLDHDPIFVQDEDGQDFIIAANDREIQLLSLETSLVVRELRAPEGLTVRCFAVQDPHASLVCIAYSDGTLSRWDWTNDGSATPEFKASASVKAMALSPSAGNEKSTLFYISNLRQGHAIFDEQRKLYMTKKDLHSIQIVGNMEYVVAQGPSVLVLGRRKDVHGSTDDFTWIELPLMTRCACFDARLVPAQPNTKKGGKWSALRIAIGNENGQIHRYEDVSLIFRQQGKPTLPSPQTLHWHREAVSSVKFSRDGNYLISGGKETVLVLWQLETGKRQYLPHLTSEIERIVVNAEGDRYALQMGDNSIMVLNTSELKPVANFAGLQMPSRIEATGGFASPAPAVTLRPRNPNQLLLAVPSTQPKSSKDIAVRPFLQTFDIRTSRHITRQALTRNNVTDFNLGPERTPIVPPDVTTIAISHDGLWLTTVDEWTPPASDLEHLASDEFGIESARSSRREVYLKFWTWDEDQALWTLTTRVDSPHARPTANSMGAGRVLALASDLGNNDFATIGEDSCVKIWKPKTRTRHGVALKGQSDENLVEWTCRRAVQLVHDKERADSPMDTLESFASMKACLAYSADGSMLAAAQSTLNPAESPVIHFINTLTGELISKPGLAAHEITEIGFLDRYFIAISHPAAYVWDLVNDTLMYKLKLSETEVPEEHKPPMLAINDGDGTFALVVQDKDAGRTRVEVYGARETKCLYKQDFKTQIEAILAGKGARGYTLLFADAMIRTLSSAATIPPRMIQPTERPSPLPAPISAQEETDAEPRDTAFDMQMDDILPSAASEQETNRAIIETEEDDRPVVRPEQLASIFDTAQSFAMPPVKDMFRGVVELFGRKPQVKPQVEVS